STRFSLSKATNNFRNTSLKSVLPLIYPSMPKVFSKYTLTVAFFGMETIGLAVPILETNVCSFPVLRPQETITIKKIHAIEINRICFITQSIVGESNSNWIIGRSTLYRMEPQNEILFLIH